MVVGREKHELQIASIGKKEFTYHRYVLQRDDTMDRGKFNDNSINDEGLQKHKNIREDKGAGFSS